MLVDNAGTRAVIGDNPNTETPEERHASLQLAKRNAQINYYGYIYGQKSSKYSNMPFGLSTVGKSGCGLIACYDSMLSIGQAVSFEHTLAYFDNLFRYGHGYWAFGLLGVTSHQVGRFLEDHGVAYKSISTIEEFNAISSPGTFIVKYWNSDSVFDGQHYVCMQYYGNNSYVVFNQFNDSTDSKPRSSIYEVIGDGRRFIDAFYIQW